MTKCCFTHVEIEGQLVGVGSGVRTQVLRLSSKHLFSLTHLASPNNCFWELMGFNVVDVVRWRWAPHIVRTTGIQKDKKALRNSPGCMEKREMYTVDWWGGQLATCYRKPNGSSIKLQPLCEPVSLCLGTFLKYIYQRVLRIPMFYEGPSVIATKPSSYQWMKG